MPALARSLARLLAHLRKKVVEVGEMFPPAVVLLHVPLALLLLDQLHRCTVFLELQDSRDRLALQQRVFAPFLLFETNKQTNKQTNKNGAMDTHRASLSLIGKQKNDNTYLLYIDGKGNLVQSSHQSRTTNCFL